MVHNLFVYSRAYGSPVKRKRGVTGAGRGTSSPAAGPATPNIEYVLAHLDLLRVQIEDGGVFNTDTMQAALLQVSFITILCFCFIQLQ